MSVINMKKIRDGVIAHRLAAGVASLAALAMITAGGVAVANAMNEAKALSEFNYAGYDAAQIKAIADCISGVSSDCPNGHDRAGWQQWAEDSLNSDANNKGTMSLVDTKGQNRTISIRLIGINHDDRADGKGKAGLTFQATGSYTDHAMNSSTTNSGGWRDSDMRQWLNTTVLDSNESVKNNVTPVVKMTNNDGYVSGVDNNNEAGSTAPTGTVDKIWLASPVEMDMPSVSGSVSTGESVKNARPSGGDFQYSYSCYWNGYNDYDLAGKPYEYWSKNATSGQKYKELFTISSGGSSSRYRYPWLRSPSPAMSGYFAYFDGYVGNLYSSSADFTDGVVPALSF